MPIKVLVVDDSSFFRKRVTEILEQDPELTVIGTAGDGQEAITQVFRLKPDVVTMDIEMPVMDGITAVRRLMATHPLPILMFSSLTHDGARATLDALEAGALDFLPKRFEEIAYRHEDAVKALQQRVRSLVHRRQMPQMQTVQATSATAGFRTQTRLVQLNASRQLSRSQVHKKEQSMNSEPHSLLATTSAAKPSRVFGSGKRYRLLALGTSTGGPVALQKILTAFPENYPHPIVITQHMPAAFTAPFAARLDSLCNIHVKEAENGDLMKPGVAYLAPGGLQMVVEKGGLHGRLSIVAGDETLNYKPCVDVTFSSAVKVFAGEVLAVILTGMGADGRAGAKLLKEAGATIWAQDEASSVVYGMPQAVMNAGHASQSIGLEQMADAILKETMPRILS